MMINTRQLGVVGETGILYIATVVFISMTLLHSRQTQS